MRLFFPTLPILKGALTVFLFCSLIGFSQKKQIQQADKLVSEKKYAEAIVLYDKIYQKKKDKTFLLKIADIYYSNENYLQAQKYYAGYFQDSVYEYIPQFGYYAKTSMSIGKIPLAVKLYQKMYDVVQDSGAKTVLDIYKLFVDSAQYTRSFNLDSNFNCVMIDATFSIDTLAAPMFYNWDFDDGKTGEGTRLEHCFESPGEHKAILNIMDQRTGLVKQRDTMVVIYIEKMPVLFTAPKKAKKYFFVDLDASETDIPGYEILDYLWDMDNGELQSGKKIKYKYNESRDYWVKLVVIARNKYNGEKKLFSVNRKIEVLENYETPSKKFTDSLNDAK